MEKTKGRKRADADSVSKKEKESSLSEPITMDAFILKSIREGKLQSWQHAEVSAFLRDMKLRDKEDLKVYEAMLGKY